MAVVAIESYAVEPDRLLVVRYAERDGTDREVVAMTCRYVPAIDATGARRIAVEVVRDPVEPEPRSSYLCPASRIERLLLPPARVHSVRPYRT